VHLLLQIGLAVLTSLIAWLLTLKVRDRFRDRHWFYHLLLFVAMFGAAYLILARIQAASVRPLSIEKLPQQPTAADGATNGAAAANVNASPEQRFVQKYIGFAGQGQRSPGQWAIVLRDENNSAQNELTGAVGGVLTRTGYKVAPVFRPEVFQDDAYRELYSANSSLLQQLQPFCDGVIAGEFKTKSFTDADMEGLVTARVMLDVRVFLTKSGTLKSHFQISSKGGGFSQETAQAQASERLAQQLKERLLRELQ
jgi:hypothetical protein